MNRYETLYHGSTENFVPGEYILPMTKSFAHATPDIETAVFFAGENSRIYEVEPLNPNDLRERFIKNIPVAADGMVEVLSETGFKVIRELHESEIDVSQEELELEYFAEDARYLGYLDGMDGMPLKSKDELADELGVSDSVLYDEISELYEYYLEGYEESELFWND